MANEIASSVSVARATIAAALATGIVFAACWLGVVVHFPATHMFVALFTLQPPDSTAALADGLLRSVAFGALFGFLISAIYKIIPVGRR